MPEIKVNPEEVTPVLDSLKTKTEELETTNPKTSFSTSELELIEKIQSIEDKYYLALNNYKNALTKVETNVQESIQAYVDTDENIAKQMGPLPVK